MVKTYKPWQYVLIVVCLFLMFFGNHLPAIWGLEAPAMLAIGMFIGTIVLMLFVDTAWPPVLLVIAAIVSKQFTVATALSASIGNSIVQYVLFATALTYSLQKSGILERVAIWIATRDLAKKHPWLFLTLLLAGPTYLGMFIDVCTNLIVFATVYMQLCDIMGYKRGDGEAFPKLLIFGTLFADAIGAAATPISHPAVILTMGMYETSTGNAINFGGYCVMGIILATIGLVLYVLMCRFVFKADVSRLQKLDASSLKDADIINTKLSKEEVANLAIFGVVVALWVFPGLLRNVIPALYELTNPWGTVTPAMMGLIALCVIPVNGKPLVSFNEAMQKGVSWGAVWITASTMMLIQVIGNSELGITDAMANAAAGAFGHISGLLFVLLAVAMVLLFTNFCSNNISVTIVYTLSIPLILAGTISGVSALGLACVLGFGCQVAVASPAGSAYAGIANGYGWFDTAFQIKIGMTMCAIMAIVLVLIGYPLGNILG